MDVNNSHRRVILHIDIDCFYAQVEILKKPELGKKPFGVKQKNIVVTSNYLARTYGIKKCMLVTEALKLCPSLILVSGEDLYDYRIYGNKIFDALKDFSNLVEKLGFDEFFLDITELVLSKLKDEVNMDVIGHCYSTPESFCECGCHGRLGIGSQIANEIRNKIEKEIGLTTSAGIAHNKLLAKLVSSLHKPNQQMTVFPNCASGLLMNTKLRSIPGFGSRIIETLNSLCIKSVEDLLKCNINILKKSFKPSVLDMMISYCQGVDESLVKPSGKPKSLSIEDAFKKISTKCEVIDKLHELLQRLKVLLIEDGRVATTLKVSVRRFKPNIKFCNRESRQQSVLIHGENTSFEKNSPLMRIAIALVGNMINLSGDFHLTLLGVGVTNFRENFNRNISILSFVKNTDSTYNKFASEYDKTSHTNYDLLVPLDMNSVNITEIKPNMTNNNDPGMDLVQEERCPQSSSLNNTVCPEGIDEKTFFELPENIQKELIEHYSINKNKKLANKGQNLITSYFK